MNAAKTKALVSSTPHIYAGISDQAYQDRTFVGGATYRERSLQKIPCEKCGSMVSRQCLSRHHLTRKCKQDAKHYIIPTSTAQTPAQPALSRHLTGTYQASVTEIGLTNCPVPNCIFQGQRRESMRRHFRSRHPFCTVIISQEGRTAFPQCTSCGLFTKANMSTHQTSKDCIKATKNRQKKIEEWNQLNTAEFVFTINGVQIETVQQFKYLGRILDHCDNDEPAVDANLQRARYKWSRLAKVLKQQGANRKMMGSFYKAIVQAILLYGAESWTLSDRVKKKLRSFHPRCARHLTGQHIRDRKDGTWDTPSTEKVLKDAGLWSMEEYINRRKKTVTKFVQEREIFRKCVATPPIASSSNQKTWW